MTDRPILFSAPMINAVLAGKKSQTRRIIKPQPEEPLDIEDGYQVWRRFRKGDRLWVREAFSYDGIDVDHHAFMPAWYWADGNPSDGDWTKPKPSIHMPRAYSRITLDVTDVRVQRLMDISEEDALAEGFAPGQLDDGFGPRDIGDGYTIESPGTYASAGGMFQIYWQKLHPDWDGFSSQWIVAITFKTRLGNIDALETVEAVA